MKSMDTTKLQELLRLDLESLEVAAADQANVFFEWANKAVEARFEYERRKANWENRRAQVSCDARKFPENYGIDKITEAAIQTAVELDKSVISDRKKYLDAREVSLLYDRAVDALEQRKRMIEMLVTLHGQQYFSTPNLKRIREACGKAADDKMTSRMKRKMKKDEE